MIEQVTEGGVLVVIELQEVYDGSAAKDYQAAAREQAVRRGAELLARGGTLFEGDSEPVAVVIQRWDSAQAFIDWQQSNEYLPLKKKREQAMKVRIFYVPIVENVSS
jgi:uncharacterized protein (DUF1330 family)